MSSVAQNSSAAQAHALATLMGYMQDLEEENKAQNIAILMLGLLVLLGYIVACTSTGAPASEGADGDGDGDGHLDGGGARTEIVLSETKADVGAEHSNIEGDHPDPTQSLERDTPGVRAPGVVYIGVSEMTTLN
eukprot:TRINITY_DN50680_c0_g1_i1.p1 TRINITY_DN50680_c0_g1~~TRINITY_DN50680_c0_g1_i1.p1  ORF type:complete len:134 (+),score=27.08 TRINITY_DN50680_c0_g1_i1:156-557(+)